MQQITSKYNKFAWWKKIFVLNNESPLNDVLCTQIYVFIIWKGCKPTSPRAIKWKKFVVQVLNTKFLLNMYQTLSE